MEDEAAEPIPLPRLAAAIVLGAVPPLAAYALLILIWLGLDGDAGWRVLGTFALFAIGSAAIVGVPIGAIVLRDPAASRLRWVLAGAGSAWIAITLVEFWVAGFSFPMMFLSFFGPALALINGVVIVYGALTGLCARAVLLRLDRP